MSGECVLYLMYLGIISKVYLSWIYFFFTKSCSITTIDNSRSPLMKEITVYFRFKYINAFSLFLFLWTHMKDIRGFSCSVEKFPLVCVLSKYVAWRCFASHEVTRPINLLLRYVLLNCVQHIWTTQQMCEQAKQSDATQHLFFNYRTKMGFAVMSCTNKVSRAYKGPL